MNEDKLWYKDAVIYELRIRSFHDADGDGIGDLAGLSQKLDYLQDLGVNTLWLLPFYPSPLKDDGYDIADYMNVHPETGTMKDFKSFLKEAHQRGLRVVTELVINHTSDHHPWFTRARKAPKGSRHRNFYVWSDDPRKYSDARIIFQDFETSNWTWDPVAGQYYWHRFYSHQPDLNFDNPAVRKAVLSVLDFWLEMGVDGLRLDAVPYLYERDGTNCENLPETHAMLKRLRAHVDRGFDDRMLLAEANQWPEDAVAYFGDGDECHMAFHFPIMPRLFMALHMEDRHPIVDILEQTPAIPETCQWALFLRNHDELTLEMVTDEERDYMVGAYAQLRQARINLGIRRRLAPLLNNNRRRIELLNALLFSLPGTPVIYYGDEIGMGDNVYLGDRDGVRTPMQWSPDRNAGFSRVNPQQLILPVVVDPEYHFEAVNVETQQRNPSSLLWWTKRLIALRKQHQAFGRGTLEILTPGNRAVLAFVRRYEGEVLLVVVNLSRFPQYVQLDLAEFRGATPVELFGRVEFPPIAEAPYLLTLGPHAFFWFALQGLKPEADLVEADVGEIVVDGAWEDVFRGAAKTQLERLLKPYVAGRRWFRGKARTLKALHITHVLPLGAGLRDARLLLIQVGYAEGDPETYVLPVRYMSGDDVPDPVTAIVWTRARGVTGIGGIVDASGDPRVAAALLDCAIRRRHHGTEAAEMVGVPARPLLELKGEATLPAARPLAVEQTNTTYVYGDVLVGKLMRRVEDGESAELEILRYLGEHGGDARVPSLAGAVELRFGRGGRATLAIFQRYEPNQGDAWTYAVGEIGRYFERILVRRDELGAAPGVSGSAYERVGSAPPPQLVELAGGFLDVARLLGRRTAELHRALVGPDDNREFSPERVTALSKRSFYQSLRNLASRSLDLLRDRSASLPPEAREKARAALKREREIRSQLKLILDRNPGGRRIRVHGDLHLGQILNVGADFVIIDFEGEPGRSLSERKRKRSPLADVAGMLRSFHYAIYGVLGFDALGPQVRSEDLPLLRPWAALLYAWASSAFLSTWLEGIAGADLLPAAADDVALLLDVHLLEKALYEVGYELNNRPDWVAIPLEGILAILG